MNTLTGDDSPSDMITAWSHTTSQALRSGSFPAHDTQVMSGYAALQTHSTTSQTTPVSCPANSAPTDHMLPAHDNYISCSINQLKNLSVAHDLMSCPKEHNMDSTSSKQSVQIKKKHSSNVEILPRKCPFSQNLTQMQPRNLFYPKNTNAIHQYNAQKTQGTMVYCFSLKKQ